jgi:Mrp family chromosome partitioning ATPase
MTKPSFRDYLRILLKRKWTVIVTFLSAILFTFLGLQFKIPEYQSQVKLMLTANDGSVRVASADSSLADTECEVMTTYPILKRVVEELNYHRRPKYYSLDYCSKLSRPVFKWFIDTQEKINRLLEGPNAGRVNPEVLLQQGVAQLLDNLKVKPITNTDLCSVFVLDYDPVESARLANMISHAYVLFSLKRRLAELNVTLGAQHPNVVELRTMINRMEKRLDNPSLFNVENLGFSNVKIVEAALPPVKPKGLPKVILMALAAVGGLGLGFVLVFVFERFDDTVRGPDDIKAYFNLPLLGSIPKTRTRKYRYHRETSALLTPKKAHFAYENLAAEIHLAIQEKQLKVVHVASALPNTDVTPIVAALGAAMAAAGKTRVLILDANLRNPSLQKLFGTEPEFHMDDFLGDQYQKPAFHKLTENLSVLPAAVSKHNPSAIYHSEKMKRFMAECKTQFDVILLNSSSLKKNNDGMILSTLADAVVYIINEGQERKQAVAAILASLQSKKINLIGVILNNRTFVIPKLFIKWL